MGGLVAADGLAGAEAEALFCAGLAEAVGVEGVLGGALDEADCDGSGESDWDGSGPLVSLDGGSEVGSASR